MGQDDPFSTGCWSTVLGAPSLTTIALVSHLASTLAPPAASTLNSSSPFYRVSRLGLTPRQCHPTGATISPHVVGFESRSLGLSLRTREIPVDRRRLFQDVFVRLRQGLS